jgi:hypothetical protein
MSDVVLPRLSDEERSAYQLAVEEWEDVLARAHNTVRELAEVFVAAELQAFYEGQRSILAALGEAASEVLGVAVDAPHSESSLRSFLLSFSTRLFERAAAGRRQANGAEIPSAEQRLAYIFHQGD